eukprot:CAMPEP_0194271558 /NCGR_PEP_ID=MMETSP0169-20130528/5289_1 /TAXON_ID=218684 /ORGANISM="Corethron pennatum, Strain L29A3" /LENGTH=558 /DNA_ID=CAMNT_0039013923 /DNA_START=593 /DNA_END=2266 /DNA_ORIENTATION=+
MSTENKVISDAQPSLKRISTPKRNDSSLVKNEETEYVRHPALEDTTAPGEVSNGMTGSVCNQENMNGEVESEEESEEKNRRRKTKSLKFTRKGFKFLNSSNKKNECLGSIGSGHLEAHSFVEPNYGRSSEPIHGRSSSERSFLQHVKSSTVARRKSDVVDRRKSGLEFLGNMRSASFFVKSGRKRDLKRRTRSIVNYHNPDGAMELAKSSLPGHELNIFVGTANFGNAMPPPTSKSNNVRNVANKATRDIDFDGNFEQGDLSSWIPYDGVVITDRQNKGSQRQKQFDLIVLGMQEAKYKVQKKKKKKKKMKYLIPSVNASINSSLNSDNKLFGMNFPETDTVREFVSFSYDSSSGESGRESFTDTDIDSPDPSERNFLICDLKKEYSLNSRKQVRIQKGWTKDTIHLYNLITSHCPSYAVVVFYLRGEMKLIVLVHEDMLSCVSDIDVQAQNTGIGGIVANKGGIVACMNVKSTKLAFLSAHLAAHEGGNYYRTRCQSITDIFNGARVGNTSHLFDASQISHHCFVLGDLNFRSDFGGNLTQKEKNKKAESILVKKDW